MRIFFSMLLIALVSSGMIYGQTGKPIRGTVIDQASGESMPGASVVVLNTSVGAMSDGDGNFIIENLPVGRYDLQVSFMGYEPSVFREILVSSGKEVFITVPLKEKINEIQEVVVKPKVNKQEPLNSLATASARMFSVEEASRYAGGMDDPARLVTSFAGVAGNIGSNGIAIRGNSPQFLQWRLEGVEIPNPTHFTDITGVGGGILTALSSQVLGNSDFFTGAFPAEYGNALSGVFDMQLRNGNRWEHEHTVQIGTLGIDVSSEGPFKKNGQASYLFNYRYATMALADQLFPGLLGEAAGMRYQDLSFKLNFPTQKAGTFSVWGVGLLDHFIDEIEKDVEKWETIEDKGKGDFKQSMGAGGIGHKYFFNPNTYLKTAIAATYNKNVLLWDVCNEQLEPTRGSDLRGTNWNITFNSYLNKKFSSRHTNRTGIQMKHMEYDLDYQMSPSFPNIELPIETYAKSKGNTLLLSAFTNSTFRLSQIITANVGVNAQYFLLNEQFSIEPRAGIKWQMASMHALGVAYGLHSRHEKLDYYFVRTPQTVDEQVNKNLSFAKAHHIVLSYDWSISDNLHLKLEPYYQFLTDIPVAKDSSFSIINHQDWYLNTPLVNDGKGRNYGIDVTLERYLAKGYYYMITGSLFESRYTGGDHVWRNTRLNRNYLFNVLGGKEWKMGKRKQNLLNVNIRASYQGGDRYIPVDEAASEIKQDVVYDTSRSFEKQLSPALITSFTLSYRMNKKKLSHELALKVINLNKHEEFGGYFYNFKKNEVEMYKMSVVMPSVSYKIEF